VVLSLFIGGRPSADIAAGDRATAPASVAAAAHEALSHGGFLAMTAAFFACGFQLMFITAHLPRFLGLCGLPPAVGATALGVIGLCNAVGSYAFGVSVSLSWPCADHGASWMSWGCPTTRHRLQHSQAAHTTVVRAVPD
jgi:hypothetical protein